MEDSNISQVFKKSQGYLGPVEIIDSLLEISFLR